MKGARVLAAIVAKGRTVGLGTTLLRCRASGMTPGLGGGSGDPGGEQRMPKGRPRPVDGGGRADETDRYVGSRIHERRVILG